VRGVVGRPHLGVVRAGPRLQVDELRLRIRGEEPGVARPAPRTAQGCGQPTARGVGEGAARGLVEGVRGQRAAARRGGGGAIALQRGDLGRGQRPRPDVELVVDAREHRIVGEVRAAEPVVRQSAQGRRVERHRRVLGDGGAVDVEGAGAAGDRDRQVAPLVERQRGGAVEALFPAGPAGRDGEARYAGRVAGGQVQVAGGVVAEVEDPGPVGVVGGLHPGRQGDRRRVVQRGCGQVDVLVGAAHVLRRGAELPGDAEHCRVLAQGGAHVGERADHGPYLGGVHLVAGARVRLRQHGQEVAGVVAAEVAVGLAVQALPAARGDRAARGEPGVGAEHLEQPVHVVAAPVVEHQLTLRGEDALADLHVLELERPERPGGGRGQRGGRGRAASRGVRERRGRRGEQRGLEEPASGEGGGHAFLVSARGVGTGAGGRLVGGDLKRSKCRTACGSSTKT
jgi:hypothetical protein